MIDFAVKMSLISTGGHRQFRSTPAAKSIAFWYRRPAAVDLIALWSAGQFSRCDVGSGFAYERLGLRGLLLGHHRENRDMHQLRKAPAGEKVFTTAKSIPQLDQLSLNHPAGQTWAAYRPLSREIVE